MFHLTVLIYREVNDQLKCDVVDWNCCCCCCRRRCAYDHSRRLRQTRVETVQSEAIAEAGHCLAVLRTELSTDKARYEAEMAHTRQLKLRWVMMRLVQRQSSVVWQTWQRRAQKARDLRVSAARLIQRLRVRLQYEYRLS